MIKSHNSKPTRQQRCFRIPSVHYGNEIFRRNVRAEFSVAADVGTGIPCSVRGLREFPVTRSFAGNYAKRW
jgi:hypothetical protein